MDEYLAFHIDDVPPEWENPTMKVIADTKRRVVLPKPVQSGDVFEILESGDRIVMLRLQKPPAIRPPTSATPLDPTALRGIDLDEPSFLALSDESPH